MKRVFNKYIIINFIYFLNFLIIIPFFLLLLLVGKTTLGDRLGFFGGYYGTVTSILFAYYNTLYQLKKEHENDIIKSLEKLIGLSRQVKENLTLAQNEMIKNVYYLSEEKILEYRTNLTEKLLDKIEKYAGEIDIYLNQTNTNDDKYLLNIENKILSQYIELSENTVDLIYMKYLESKDKGSKIKEQSLKLLKKLDQFENNFIEGQNEILSMYKIIKPNTNMVFEKH